MAVTLIAHTEVGSGGAANIEFTSIPGTYDDLFVVTSFRQPGAFANGDTDLVFNGDTGSNYSTTRIQASGTSALSARTTSQTNLFVSDDPAANGTVSTFSSNNLYIPDYKNTSNYKQVIVDNVREANSSTAYFMALWAGLWRSTSAITSIKFIPERGSYVQYSTATLYGVKKF
jgi:hypothetical protein